VVIRPGRDGQTVAIPDRVALGYARPIALATLESARPHHNTSRDMPRARSEKSRFELELPRLDFYVLAGSCADAALSRDRDVIRGCFGVARPKRYWQLVAKFANWPTDERHIVRFVRRFGPLTVPYDSRGGRFSMRLEEWRDFQRSFRLAWEKWKGIGGAIR
jgi:hypothetical protein